MRNSDQPTKKVQHLGRVRTTDLSRGFQPNPKRLTDQATVISYKKYPILQYLTSIKSLRCRKSRENWYTLVFRAMRPSNFFALE